jgi:C-terminal regulatory domain of Threonine dehydratase
VLPERNVVNLMAQGDEMNIPPNAADGGKALVDNGIGSRNDGNGLTAIEFVGAAKLNYENGHHPIAIGRKVGEKPAGKAPWRDGATGRGGIDATPDKINGWPANVADRIAGYGSGSGIRLYRVPDDWVGVTLLKTDDGEVGHIELIQRHHRLVAAPPSHHPTGLALPGVRRETGEALVGIELGSAADLDGLLARMDDSDMHVETLEPDSPVYRYLT